MGQAVGMAAAIGIAEGADPRAVCERSVGRVQQRLLKEDVFIPNLVNEDPDDLARSATVTASSQESEALGPEQAASGVSRPAGGRTNLWASASGKTAGEWIQLSWDGTRAVGEVRLTFDTNLKPAFAYSIFSLVRHEVQAPVPGTVSDYRIEARLADEWQTLERVAGNYQRHRIHRFEPVRTEALRVVFEKTNGADQVRLYEMRAY
jgi:hypothetical protein